MFSNSSYVERKIRINKTGEVCEITDTCGDVKWNWTTPFEIGQRVILNEKHPDYQRWLVQSGNTPGTIIDMKELSNEKWKFPQVLNAFIKVKWDNGDSNSYQVGSLLPENMEGEEGLNMEIKIGEKVCLNPEHKDYANILSMLDNKTSGYKVNNYSKLSSTILFDDNVTTTLRHTQLLKVDAPIKKVSLYEFANGDTRYILDNDVSPIDRLVINKGWQIINRKEIS